MPPFFYVENPTNVAGGREAESAPRVGVTFNGTRRDVLIDDVIAINGPRVPVVHRLAARPSPGVPAGGRARADRPTAPRSTKLDRIRRAWETFFQQATEGRMQAVTTLR